MAGATYGTEFSMCNLIMQYLIGIYLIMEDQMSYHTQKKGKKCLLAIDNTTSTPLMLKT